MSDAPDTFMSHLIELRARLVRAIVAVLAVFVVLFFWSSQIYDLLAAPMISVLPPGAHMIATGVVTPFLVPMKMTLLLSFFVALP